MLMRGPCSWCGKEGESCLIVVSNRENRVDEGFICEDCLREAIKRGEQRDERDPGERDHDAGRGAWAEL